MQRSPWFARVVPSAAFPALVAVLGLLLPFAAQARVRVHLRNGFSYDCVAQQPLDATHVRLILAVSGDAAQVSASTENYVDLPSDTILSTEALPDPPPVAAVVRAGVPSPVQNLADVQPFLAHAGGTHDIDVDLLASIVHAESGGHPLAISRSGAQGLMQLMPGTAALLGVHDAFAPEQNINGGTAYLDALLTRYHDNLALALAAYNAGPAAVDHYHGIPPYRETRAYVVRVMSEFKARKLSSRQVRHVAP